jgi:chemotaxis protein methyltransferase CheR
MSMSSIGEGSAMQREFSFTDDDFQQVVTLVRGYTGIALADSKRELVYGRLVRRLRAMRVDSFGEYLQQLQKGDQTELQQFCNAITTNLTAFFRENHHFEFLAKQLVPMLLKRNAARRRIRIWSAGCSTGEEPYSVAIVLQEAMQELRNWDVRILATDLDSNVLGHGERGSYDADRFEKMDPERQRRWFSRSADGRYSVNQQLRSMISFKPLNLIGTWPFNGPFDLILCRNVMIYFERDTQRDIVERMAEHQCIGDYLFLGHSESLLNVSTRYALEGQTIHRKIA